MFNKVYNDSRWQLPAHHEDDVIPDSKSTDREEKHRLLIANLKRPGEGWRPTAEDLATAPLLADWYCSLQPVTDHLCLYGNVTGHPLIRDGRIATSPLIAFDPERGWV